MTKFKLFTVVAISIAVGVLAGGFALKRYPSQANSRNSFALPPDASSSDAFKFINPAVKSNLNKHFIINFIDLKKQFLEIQKKYPQHTYAYFVYLNNSSWVGLGERELFTAASLVKVPLAMSVYKAIEGGKLALSDKYVLDGLDLNDRFGDLYKVGAGKEYTIEQLLETMLTYSDNTAANALYRLLNTMGIEDPLDDVYGFMGWEFEFGKKPDYEKINLKTLSNMFIELYNAHYINIEHSEKILEYLSNTPFNDKIVAGIPVKISVSHKIGVSNNGETFSDCGIVYAPNRNYLLCVGSNGGDEGLAKKFMAEVSRAVYDYVINN